MADIAGTILRGTDQMSEAYQGLARVRATNRARKDAAVRAATDSLGEAAKAFKQYGTWKDGKAAESDQKAALEAARLGRVQGAGDPAAELTALDAYKPSTLAGYKIAVQRRDAATKRAQELGQSQYRDVEKAHLQAQTDEIKAKSQKAATDATDRQKFLDGGGIDLGPDASPTEVQTIHDILSGAVSVKEAKPILDMEKARRSREAAAGKAEMKAKATQADTDTFNKALEAYNRNEPVLDPTTNAYRPPTEADRMAAVDAVDGITPKHRQAIAQLSQQRVTQAFRQKTEAEHMSLEREKFQTQTTAANLRAALEASGQDARAVLAGNAQARQAAADVITESQKQLAQSNVQRLRDGVDPTLSDEDKKRRQDERDKSDTEAQRNLTEFGAILKQIGQGGGKPVAPAPRTAPAQGVGIDIMPNGQKDSGFDYDYAAAKAAGVKRGSNGHLPDTYKKPWHESFSTESASAKQYPDLAGTWNGETYNETPTHAFMMQMSDEDKVAFANLTPEQRAQAMKMAGR